MNWNFPTNNDGDINGISNSGIEMFQGTPLKSLAREICQNSLDASLEGTITKVEFELYEIDVNKIPDFNSLIEVFNMSYDFWNIQESKKAKDFFERAILLSKQHKLPILRISDYNTKGLEGSDGVYNTPWCNLTKSSGTSDKSGSAGGSFGIGKYAPFACSDLRTIFYNTVAVDGKKAFQGISRLTSFKNRDDEITTGVGYYGDNHNKPMQMNFSLQDCYIRDESQTGTDIYILGFKYNDWKTDIITSILDGFLYAINNGNLEVVINHDICISKETLKEIIDEYSDENTLILREYYEVLTSMETRWTHTNLKNKGLVHLGLIVKDCETKRSVAMVRKTGMKIKNKTGISGWIQFSGVMYFEGKEINEYLISMENPQHTQWEPYRVRGHENEAKDFLREITIFIKESLNSIVQTQQNEEFDPMIGDLLPFESNDEKISPQNKTETINDEISNIKKKDKDILVPRARLFSENKYGDDTLTSPFGFEDEISNNSNYGDNQTFNDDNKEQVFESHKNPDEVFNEKATNIDSSKLRFICTNKSLGMYSICFVPVCSAKKCHFEIFQVAETDMYKIHLLDVKGLGDANNVTFEDNQISNINFEKGMPIRFRVKLDTEDYCALEVRAYGIKI